VGLQWVATQFVGLNFRFGSGPAGRKRKLNVASRS